MRQPVFGSTTASVTTAVTRYMSLWASTTAAWQTSNVLTNRAYIYQPFTLTNFVVDVDVAPGAGVTRAFTVQIDGNDTAMTASIAEGATRAVFYGTISGTSGQYIGLKQVISGGTAAAAGQFRWSSMLSTPNKICVVPFSNGNSPNNGARTWGYSMNQYNLGWPGTEGAATRVYLPGAYNLKAIYAAINTAPGAGKSWTLSYYKNGSDVAATQFTISGAAQTSNSITGISSVSGVATDYFSFSILPAGTPSSAGSWTITTEWEPAVNGESFACADPITVSGAATTWFQNIHPGIVGSTAAETTMRYICPPGLDFWVKDFRVVTTAPGAGDSRIFTTRKNSAATGMNNTITVSDVATTGSDLSSVDRFTSLDYISCQCAITGTPASASVNYYNTIWCPPNPIISSS